MQDSIKTNKILHINFFIPCNDKFIEILDAKIRLAQTITDTKKIR